MFANAIRTQARLALSSCRARASITSAARLVPRGAMVPVSFTSRPLSTSRPVLNDYESSGFAREAAPVKKNPPSNCIFVDNLPYSVEEAELREKFEPYGDITSIRIAFRPDGTARGFAHVEFANQADAVAAFDSMSQEPPYILDRDLRVDYAGQRTTRAADAQNEPFHKLYFRGFRGDERVLRSALQQFENSVIDVFFLKNRETGERTDTGFIDFMSVERATEALNELNGQDIGEGQTLTLQYARPPRQRSEGGQRFGGDGERRNDRRGGYNSGGRGGGGGGYEGGRGGRQGGYGGGRRDDGGYGGGRY